jgi:hypothetical protein
MRGEEGDDTATPRESPATLAVGHSGQAVDQQAGVQIEDGCGRRDAQVQLRPTALLRGPSPIMASARAFAAARPDGASRRR